MILPKPLKFGLSIAILLATVLPVLSILDISARTRALITWTLLGTMAVELAAITLQAVRGTTSHFNTATRFDTLVWNAMLAAILVAFVALVAFAILVTIRELDCAPLIALGIRLGAWLLLLSAVSGFAMGGQGQHSVGGVDAAGEALPVTGWSREHGDLRVPHFFALHGLQVLPLVGLVLGSLRIGERMRIAIFAVVAAGWIFVAVATLFAAFAGRPMIARS